MCAELLPATMFAGKAVTCSRAKSRLAISTPVQLIKLALDY